ncbi:TniQ family protein [Alicyclobacillus acidiphilus]|uniref:TniQ family protein n=1 Tax=Alicyclobacillus acidiphilus TaxID=182455 RepID=UPI000B0F892A|nr:TniQ family protein [Alicyclobacillus acidiphilus]
MQFDSDTWESLPIPTRSMLYALKPITSPRPESLTSYVNRLVYEHGMNMAIFLASVWAPAVDKKYLNRITANGGTRYLAHSVAMNGVGQSTREAIQVLSRLTHVVGLEQLTFYPWRHVLSVRNLLRTKRAWCPMCYDAWRATGQITHEPLLWSVQVVTICPRHRIQLRDTCVCCGRQLYHWERYVQPGFCRCGQWLGSTEVSKTNAMSSPNFYENIQPDIATCVDEMIRFAVNNPNVTGAQSTSDILRRLLVLTDGNCAKLAREIGVPKNTLWGWYWGKSRIPLPTLVQISLRLGKSIAEILTDEIPHVRSDLSVKKNIRLIRPFRKRSNTNHTNQNETARALEEALTRIPPPSLAQVARELGVNRRQLRVWHPELSRALSARYEEARRKACDHRLKHLKEVITDCVADLYATGIYPSARAVERTLGKPGLLRETSVRDIWRQAKETCLRNDNAIGPSADQNGDITRVLVSSFTR